MRDTSVLREFHASTSRDVLVLYHHVRDRAFDAFNSEEYHDQMLRYYAGGFSVVLVAPRTIEGSEYSLICLQHKEAARNMLCELSFLCLRQFAGAGMLVKRRCFVCGKPTSKRCQACHCASYCSKECQKEHWKKHKPDCVSLDSRARAALHAPSSQPSHDLAGSKREGQGEKNNSPTMGG